MVYHQKDKLPAVWHSSWVMGCFEFISRKNLLDFRLAIPILTGRAKKPCSTFSDTQPSTVIACWLLRHPHIFWPVSVTCYCSSTWALFLCGLLFEPVPVHRKMVERLSLSSLLLRAVHTVASVAGYVSVHVCVTQTLPLSALSNTETPLVACLVLHF